MNAALVTVGLALGIVTVVALEQTKGEAAEQRVARATAQLSGQGITGTVELREIDLATKGARDPKFPTGSMGVELTVTVSGLAPGTHGVHLHAVGKCEVPGFTSAGGHLDPGPHGMSDPDANHPFHMGDLPNLVADAQGRATMTAITTRVTLSPGLLSVFDEDGTALIVHGNPDQGVTGEPKAGLSGGPRVACGVIVK